MSELLAVLLGAVAAYVFDLRKSARERARALADSAADRRRLRASIATAILADLQSLESPLLQFYHHPAPAKWKGERPRLFFDSLRGDVREFCADSVHMIAEFFRRSDDLFSTLQGAGAVPPHQLDEFNHSLRAKAGFALQTMPQAKAALEAEGGQVPPVRTLEIIYRPALPTLPPRSFPEISATPGEELPDQLR